MSEDEKSCPDCGRPLSPGALTGVPCQACLMGLALDELQPTEASSGIPPEFADPDKIGPFRVIRRLGEGGMGVVFLAEQEEPIRREVAVKVVKLGVGSEQFLSRFQRERQSLALMDHTNIARIFDAGSTEHSQPYFVMEFVDGSPVTRYCDEQRLSTEQRLRIFIQVCAAVQHAHQKGVIHRDLKPSNILVRDGQAGPEPKIIDFGIAKAIEKRSLDWTFNTEIGRLVGTPAYMSPEQADAAETDIDTRTDVYSLGVVLYELLVGVTPHDSRELTRQGLAGMLQTLRHGEVPTPSSRVRTATDVSAEVAARRGTNNSSLARKLRGELDWIVMRAMAKERDRRYESASGLMHDIERYLNNEPVSAGPPSNVYRLRKFVARNRFAVVSAVVLFVGMAAAVGGVSVGMVRARQAERTAREQAEIAEATNRFLNEDLLASVSPEISGADVKVRDVLDSASELIESRFPESPLTRAAIHATVGQTYARLGELDAALPHIENALQLRQEELGDRDPQTADTLRDLGGLLAMSGDLERSKELLERACADQFEMIGPDDERTIVCNRELATVLTWRGEFEAAEELYADGLQRARRVLGGGHRETVTLINDYGLLFAKQRRHDEAELLLLEAHAGFVALGGELSADALIAASNVATGMFSQGKFDEAVPRFEQLRENHREVFGERHIRTLTVTGNLATVFSRSGQVERALEIYREIAPLQIEILGAENRRTLTTINNLGRAYLKLDRREEAREALERAASGRRNTLGILHPRTASTMSYLAYAYSLDGYYDRAFALIGELLAHRETLAEKSPRALAEVLTRHGYLLTDVERFDEAERSLLEAYELYEGVGEGNSTEREWTTKYLLQLYEKWGKPERMKRWQEAE